MYGYEINTEGFFLCDVPNEKAAEGTNLWTRDPVIQPANKPRYIGGRPIQEGSGEQTGGTWIDAEAASAEDIARQEFETGRLELIAAIQNRLDQIAKERGYDSILSLCSYATSTVPKFRAEGQAGVDLRDKCWLIGYQVLSDIVNGVREFPSVEEALTMMPQIEWPVD